MRHRFVTVCLLIASHGIAFGNATSQSAATPQPPSKKLLFLTHAALYKHSSLAPAEKAVAELGGRNGFAVTTLEGYKQDSNAIDLSMLTPEYLAQLIEAYNYYFYHYEETPLLVVDTNEIDFVNRPSDFDDLVAQIQKARRGVQYYVPAGGVK